MTWFEALTGIPETSPDRVREQILLEGGRLTSRANGRTFTWGRLETPSLGELRRRVDEARPGAGRLALREVVADVADLHADPANAGAFFQVASQFNLLEMVGPQVTPEQGIGIYEHDRTQGPICAIAAGAGTLYRNYLVPVNGCIGQSADNQIDCLADLGTALGNQEQQLWEMRNGYALASRAGLEAINRRLEEANEKERDRLRQCLRIGVQWDTQVTLRGVGHSVTQAYCSALPVAYSSHPRGLWEGFARLVLEAAYEAALHTATLNAMATGNNRVFLTLLGGGAFGNDDDWIAEGLGRALEFCRNRKLDVAVVSYGASKPVVRRLVGRFQV